MLARLLDDPTFSMLSSMIYFHQVAILNHLQHNEDFTTALFKIFEDGSSSLNTKNSAANENSTTKATESGDENNALTTSASSHGDILGNAASTTGEESSISQKRDAIRFIHQFCLTAKNLQANQRAYLYTNFIKKRLFDVIVFALRDSVPNIRSAGTELILAIIDHDPSLVRNVELNSDGQNSTAIVDTLIDILLSEPDFGITSQVAEALQILLDPTSGQPYDVFRKTSDILVRQRADDPETEMFLDSFYGSSVGKLFNKLTLLSDEDVNSMSSGGASFYNCLCDLVCAFIRLHGYRSRTFFIESNLLLNVGKLFQSSHKSLKLGMSIFFFSCYDHDPY